MTTASVETRAATLTTVKKAVADLTPADYNPNDMTDAQLRALSASMREFGYVEPIVWNEQSGNIVGGHQRVRCLKADGVEEVDVVVVNLSDSDERTLNVALNTIRGEQGPDALAAVLADISEAQRGLAGWDADAFDALLARTHEHLTAGQKDPDAQPGRVKARTKPGDVFTLGEHRLVCDDSINGGELPMLFKHDVRADCVFTSPPYGVGIDYGKGYQDTFANACALVKQMPNALAPHVVEGGFIVVNFGDIIGAQKGKNVGEYPMALVYFPAFMDAGWCLWSRRMYKKPIGRVFCTQHCIHSNRAAPDFEHVWTFKRSGERKTIRRQTPGEFASQLGHFGSKDSPEQRRSEHGAAMPVEIAQRMIAVHSRKKGIVLDPFAGTGTTLIACETMGRTCYAVEQNPAFCDIVLRRWEDFTGAKARKG